MKKLLLNHPALKGLLMLLTILFAMPQAALADDDPQQSKPTYKLTSGDGIVSFYMKGEHYPIEVTEAPEGALITVSPEFEKIPAGKYATGEYTSEQVTVTPALDEDTGLPKNTSDGQFTMPAMAVTVSAVLADQGEYLVDLLNQTTQVVPESIWTLLYSLDYSNEDPESPHYNNSDEDGNRYLDLDLDGENDLQVKEDVDETTQVTTYSLVRLVGADKLKNCRFAVSYIHPYPYNSVFFRLKPVTVKADKKKKYAHADDPELTATIEGLADDDKQKAGIIAYTISRAEGEKTGTYDITPSGDAEQGNYSVTFESAKLYILHAPSPYGVWVNEIAVTADNRLDILGDGDAANKKAPSVQYFEDGNVLVLTNATVETIESEGDLEVYLAPESQNTVGSITRGINDPQDPDENVAQSRSAGWGAPVVGGKTTFQNRGKLSLTSDLNFYGKMNFPHLTGQTTISNYSEIVTGGRLITFDAAGNVIAAPASATQEIAAVRADRTPVTQDMAVGASTIADAVNKANVAKGSKITVLMGGHCVINGEATPNIAIVSGSTVGGSVIGGTSESGEANNKVASVTVSMQNYDQPGGDAVKTDSKTGETAVSLKSESGLSEVYRLYNPHTGLHHYTKDPQERDALCSGGWQSEGSSFQGELISGAELELSAGKGNFSVDCHEASTQLVVAIKPLIEVQEPLRLHPKKFYTGESRGINAQIGNTKGRSVQTFTYNLSSPARVIIFKESANVTKSRSANNDEEESELLIYGIDINPEKVYACNSIAEVTGGEYVGLEYIQEELPGQKVTGDDADLPKPGDVNGDDVVNAVDIVMTIDHINGGFSATFCKSAANLKADDTIDQADVDEMVKLILNQK